MRLSIWDVVAAAVVGVILSLTIWRLVMADHQVMLPGIPNTPLMQNVIKDGEVAWCVDATAAAYPNFVAQMYQVNDAAYNRLGVKHRQVPFDSSCEVQHTMPEGITCDGWAGRIYYYNWPVTVEYCKALGYFDWKTTQAHEGTNGGHAMGLHEQYADSGGQIQCKTGATYTVMSCGTGVWQLTQWDRDNIATWLYPKPKQWAWPFNSEAGFGVYWSEEQSAVGTRIAIVGWDYVTNQTFWIRTVPASLRFTVLPDLPHTCVYVIYQNATMTSVNGENGVTGAYPCNP